MKKVKTKGKSKKKCINLCNYIIIAIFLAFLYLPTLVFPFVQDMLSEDNSENRKLATFPKVENIHDLAKFPAGFDAYWSDNLPFRNVIQQAYADSNFLLFRISPSSRVIVGKDDGDWRHTWLFYNDVRDGDPIGNIKGNHSLTEFEMRVYLARIKDNTAKVVQQYGADLYYVVAPNKSTAYQEYLPSSIGAITDETPAESLYKFLKANGVENYLFLKDDIQSEKDRNQVAGVNYPLYRSLDTHWNQYGAFVGAKSLLSLMEPQFNAYDGYSVHFEGYTNETGDLKMFSNLNLDLVDQDVKVQTGVSAGVTKISDASGLEIMTNEFPIINKTVLIVGDSYRTMFASWLANIYREVIHLHRSAYSSKLLDKYNVDIIILETVERYTMVNAGFQL